MTVQLKKVDGGFQVLIPDELVAAAGLGENVPAEIRVFADRIEIWSPEHVQGVYQRMIDGITPETLHDPHEPYDLPAGLERVPE